MTRSRKLIVFLCYAKEDELRVRKLYEQLKEEVWIRPWFNKEDILPGQNWEYEIEKALKKAHSIIVFLSKKSTKKESFLQKEIKIALEVADEKTPDTIFILPLRLDNCDVPPNLRKFQYHDYFVDGAEYEKILKALKGRARKLHIKTDFNNEKVDTMMSDEGVSLVTRQVELVLGLELQYIENSVPFVLSKKLSIDKQSVVIQPGWVNEKVIVRLPEGAALDLILLWKNGDSDLVGLLRLKGCRILDEAPLPFLGMNTNLLTSQAGLSIPEEPIDT
ncbi:MAG: hypothetical protein DPW18_18920 [Chloroflexi bacterium]|nr:hypothetical protein [Chloroflexota bacterium]MDL1942842.1 toll/interleukin-1 receptor domain-containing protein [Chloroflexi bacterium CFX2]